MIIWKHKHELIDEVCVIFENKYCLLNNLNNPDHQEALEGGGKGYSNINSYFQIILDMLVFMNTCVLVQISFVDV